jgi:hypothetical protein
MPTSCLGSTARAAAALGAGVIIAACIVQQEPQPAPPSNEVAYAQQQPAGAPGTLADGDYACRISTDGYEYPPFPCVVYSGDDGGQLLEKTGGSQRFRGRVLPDGDGFRFDGTFFCPYGDCTDDVSGSFEPIGQGWYRGTLQGYSDQQRPIVVTLQHMPGGFSYGGAAYGAPRY